MTPSLRSRVVEAGALASYEVLGDIDKPYLLRTDTTIFHAVAISVLDAMLDCLTENADEWDHAAMDKFPKKDISDIGPRELLAVLRNPE